MTSAGAKLVAQLLAVEDGDTPLPLRKLVLHSNDIDAEGYAAVGAAVRHERCGLKEIVVSTHVKESKSGSRKTVATTEHYSIKLHEVRSMLEMCHEFFGDAELMLLSELLLLNPSSISRRMPSVTMARTPSAALSAPAGFPSAHCACKAITSVRRALSR